MFLGSDDWHYIDSSYNDWQWLTMIDDSIFPKNIKFLKFILLFSKVCDRGRFLGQLFPSFLGRDGKDLSDHLWPLWGGHLSCQVARFSIVVYHFQNDSIYSKATNVTNMLLRSECNNTSDCYIVSGSEDCTVKVPNSKQTLQHFFSPGAPLALEC